MLYWMEKKNIQTWTLLTDMHDAPKNQYLEHKKTYICNFKKFQINVFGPNKT